MKIFFFLLQAVAVVVLVVFAMQGHVAHGLIWGGLVSSIGYGPVRVSHSAAATPPRTEKLAEKQPARKSA